MIGNATQVSLVTSAGLISAKVVKVDAANNLALLKAEGRFAALPVAASRGVKLGGTVATIQMKIAEWRMKKLCHAGFVPTGLASFIILHFSSVAVRRGR